MTFKINKEYTITGFSFKCPKNYIHTLLSMGFIPGTKFTIKKIAPLKDPYQIEIKGYSLSIRKSELEMLEVK